jgi:hypothetical protein
MENSSTIHLITWHSAIGGGMRKGGMFIMEQDDYAEIKLTDQEYRDLKYTIYTSRNKRGVFGTERFSTIRFHLVRNIMDNTRMTLFEGEDGSWYLPAFGNGSYDFRSLGDMKQILGKFSVINGARPVTIQNLGWSDLAESAVIEHVLNFITEKAH